MVTGTPIDLAAAVRHTLGGTAITRPVRHVRYELGAGAQAELREIVARWLERTELACGAVRPG